MFMKRIVLIITALVYMCGIACAQDATTDNAPRTLFTYPTAPDTCTTLESRCNYIITHFWDSYDYSRPITDDEAFGNTFRDYVSFFRYAHRNVVKSSIHDFVNKSQANSSNLIKVAALAEYTLYSRNAIYWSDEVYVAFAKPLAGAKGLPTNIRNRFKDQLQRINGNQQGAVMDLEYTAVDGTKHRLSELQAQTYILLFIDDSTDSSMGRVRLSTDVALNNVLDAGNVVLLCLSMCKYSTEWATQAASYNANWIAGCSDQIAKTIDLRGVPSCYLLDNERKIVHKQVSVEALKTIVSPY